MRPVVPRPPILHLQVKTWQKDSHGLYDYESDKLYIDNFYIEGPCKIFRNWFSTSTCVISTDKIKKGFLPDHEYSFLASIVLNHNGNYDQFSLTTPQTANLGSLDSNRNPNSLNTNSYIVVNKHRDNHKEHGFGLQPGNIIKIGRVEFKIVEIGGIPRHRNRQILENIFLGEFNGIFNAKEKVTGTCKFCLQQEDEEDNFLISPCNCSGSCQGVHVQCLKQWIDSKVKKQNKSLVKTYNFAKFQCEICKVPFPRMVIRENLLNGGRDTFKMEMITIERPDRPYIILEGINERQQSKEQRCMHVVSPSEYQSVKIGRGHQCEIHLQDISVSRQHSEIKYADGEFFLNDQDSKFGTLVRLQKGIDLYGTVRLQIGRTLYEFRSE